MDINANDYTLALPTEIIKLIFIDTFAEDLAIKSAVELTCRRFYLVARTLRRKCYMDLVEYYLLHQSASGVEFALSLGYRFISHRHMRPLVKNSFETVEKILDVVGIGNIRQSEYVAECLRKGAAGHMMLAIKRGYQPDIYIITVAVDYSRPEMLISLLNHMQDMSDRLHAIEAAIMHSFMHMSLFKMLELGLKLKYLSLDPRYVSMVIYAIYKHSSGTQEPEFIIRWLLDNLQYQPIFIPVRESFTRVNNMLRQHRFKFIRCDVKDVNHLFSAWL